MTNNTTKKSDFPSFEKFHNFVMWGQKENKKNPWKFWTVEMYKFLSDWFWIYLYEHIKDWKDIQEALDEFDKLTKVNF